MTIQWMGYRPSVADGQHIKNYVRQLAVAPPGEQNKIVLTHLQVAIAELQRPVDIRQMATILLLDNTTNMAMLFSRKQIRELAL